MFTQITKLQKLTISAFSDPQRNQPLGDFQAWFNPQTYQQRSSVNYARPQGINTSGQTQVYNFTPAQELSFKLILNSTGPMFLQLNGATVSSAIERFWELTCNYNGQIHQPNFLNIHWGDLNFNCRLQSVTINHTLFDEEGRSLNAEIDTVFIADEPAETLVKEENKQSPDMTHIRYITAAADLPLIANEVYADPNYYLPLAQFNQLDNFRELPYGQKIVCPPLEWLS